MANTEKLLLRIPLTLCFSSRRCLRYQELEFCIKLVDFVGEQEIRKFLWNFTLSGRMDLSLRTFSWFWLSLNRKPCSNFTQHRPWRVSSHTCALQLNSTASRWNSRQWITLVGVNFGYGCWLVHDMLVWIMNGISDGKLIRRLKVNRSRN